MINVFSRDDYIKAAKELGHSQEFIDGILIYRDVLVSRNLPVIFSTQHLAELLEMNYDELKEVIYNSTEEYNNFKISKKHGGFRVIMAPKDRLKYIQLWIKTNILEQIQVSSACKGFVKGQSIKTNAQVHEGKKIILKVDLLKFFDTINQNRVYGMFKSFGYDRKLAFDLAKLTTAKPSRFYFNSIIKLADKIQIYYKVPSDDMAKYTVLNNIKLDNFIADLKSEGAYVSFNNENYIIKFYNDMDADKFTFQEMKALGRNLKDRYSILENGQLRIITSTNQMIPIRDTVLPQGAPTSPYIANILTKKLDIRLMSLAEKVGAGYSRYADDLTFSSDGEIPSINTIDKIVSDEGFTINRSKTKIQKRGSMQRVTGLTITNGVHVPKQYKKDILYHLHYCQLNGPIEHMKVNNITRASFKDWLYGKICYVYSIEPEAGKKMMNLFNSIDWLM